MKRDMDLIRTLLLAIEDGANPEMQRQPEVAGVEAEAIAYHLGLLRDAGYINAGVYSDKSETEFYQLRLNWTGHEFLDSVRDPDTWKATKDGAKKVGAWTLPIIQKIAEGVALAKLKALGLG